MCGKRQITAVVTIVSIYVKLRNPTAYKEGCSITSLTGIAVGKRKRRKRTLSDDLRNLLQSIGALSELLGIMRDEFIKSGFTREESVYLVGQILQSVVKNRNDEETGK
jgi:hypothetical protein